MDGDGELNAGDAGGVRHTCLILQLVNSLKFVLLSFTSKRLARKPQFFLVVWMKTSKRLEKNQGKSQFFQKSTNFQLH